MVKRKKTKSTKTKKGSKTSKSQIGKKGRQIILDKLRQITISHAYNNPNDSDRSVLPCANNVTSPRGNSQLVHTNASNPTSNVAYDDHTCYRCKHFLQVPRNLSLPLCKTTPAFIGRCEVELNFVRAIVWLKSTIASVSQISVEQLRQIFNRQWNAPVDETILQSHSVPEDVQSETLNITPIDNSDSLLIDDTPTSQICTNYTAENARKNDSSSCVIPETDAEHSSSLEDMFQSSCASSYAFEGQKEMELEEDAGWSANLTSESHIDGTDKETVDKANAYFAEGQRADASSNRKSVSLSRNESIKSTLTLDGYSGELLIASQCSLVDKLFPLMPSCSSDLVITQIDAISQLSSQTLSLSSVCQENVDSFLTDKVPPIFPNVTYDGDNFGSPIDDVGCGARINKVTVENLRHDSAYSTSNTDALNCVITARWTGDECTSKTDTEYHSKLQPCRRKTVTHKHVASSLPVLGPTKTHKRQSQFSLPEKSEPKCFKNSSGEERSSVEGSISANWLNFTLESLNVEHVIVESLKVILSVLCDERTASDYVTRRCWKDTLEEEAVNAALNVSDILIMERKPNVCAKEIMTAITESLHEIVTCGRLHQTPMLMYRVQIILQLCNSLSICVGIIDHLILVKLKSFQSALIRHATNIQQNTHAMINQLHLLFYALNIAIQKYRIIVPRDQESRITENAIPHVADLWKRHYVSIDDLECMSLNLDITKTRWLNELENFTAVSMENYVQFAEKSRSLFHTLTS